MAKQNVCVVILAGGSGTRFWPMSRQNKPKQFLNIVGELSLLQATAVRVASRVTGDRIYVVTNRKYRAQVAAQLKAFGVPAGNILLEPSGKNTAPAVCWAAARIESRHPGAVMAVLPSDHLIQNKGTFLSHLDAACRLARDGYLVTMGIVPTRPDTGYGYLETRTTASGGKKLCRVLRFTEKPDLARAKKFLKAGRYLWNSGMFFWRTDVILKEFQQHLPEVHALLGARADDAHIRRVWAKLPGISIDYGILEKSDKVVTVPAGDMAWSDVGSWESLWDVLPKDRAGNAVRGEALVFDSRRNLIVNAAGKRLIAAIGLEDLIIVDTPDALLLCPKSLCQNVREVVEVLKKQQRSGLY